MGSITKGLKLIASGIVGSSNSVIAKKWLEFQFWLNGRDWDIPLGPVFGQAGTTTVIAVAPQCYFRGEKLIATDTGGALPKTNATPVFIKKGRGVPRKKGITPVEIPDDVAKPGLGTRITQVLIGQRLQMPATGGGSLTLFFANNALGNGLRWDVCHPALMISITISFVHSCTFDGVIFGRAIV